MPVNFRNILLVQSEAWSPCALMWNVGSMMANDSIRSRLALYLEYFLVCFPHSLASFLSEVISFQTV